jgi:hypothetical protein
MNEEEKLILWNRYFNKTTLETSILKDPRRKMKKIMLLRKVIIIPLLQLIPHMNHGLDILAHHIIWKPNKNLLLI